VLKTHDRWWRDTFCKALEQHGGPDPRGQLLALPGVIQELIEGEDFNGCIFVNVAVAFPLPHDPIHVAAAEHKAQMELILRDLALRAGASDPLALAEEVGLALEGAYVTQQVTRRAGTADIFLRMIQSLVDRYVPLPA
jgi:hypothetical protein